MSRKKDIEKLFKFMERNGVSAKAMDMHLLLVESIKETMSRRYLTYDWTVPHKYPLSTQRFDNLQSKIKVHEGLAPISIDRMKNAERVHWWHWSIMIEGSVKKVKKGVNETSNYASLLESMLACDLEEAESEIETDYDDADADIYDAEND